MSSSSATSSRPKRRSSILSNPRPNGQSIYAEVPSSEAAVPPSPSQQGAEEEVDQLASSPNKLVKKNKKKKLEKKKRAQAAQAATPERGPEQGDKDKGTVSNEKELEEKEWLRQLLAKKQASLLLEQQQQQQQTASIRPTAPQSPTQVANSSSATPAQKMTKPKKDTAVVGVETEEQRAAKSEESRPTPKKLKAKKKVTLVEPDSNATVTTSSETPNSVPSRTTQPTLTAPASNSVDNATAKEQDSAAAASETDKKAEKEKLKAERREAKKAEKKRLRKLEREKAKSTAASSAASAPVTVESQKEGKVGGAARSVEAAKPTTTVAGDKMEDKPTAKVVAVAPPSEQKKQKKQQKKKEPEVSSNTEKEDRMQLDAVPTAQASVDAATTVTQVKKDKKSKGKAKDVVASAPTTDPTPSAQTSTSATTGAKAASKKRKRSDSVSEAPVSASSPSKAATKTSPAETPSHVSAPKSKKRKVVTSEPVPSTSRALIPAPTPARKSDSASSASTRSLRSQSKSSPAKTAAPPTPSTSRSQKPKSPPKKTSASSSTAVNKASAVQALSVHRRDGTPAPLIKAAVPILISTVYSFPPDQSLLGNERLVEALVDALASAGYEKCMKRGLERGIKRFRGEEDLHDGDSEQGGAPSVEDLGKQGDETEDQHMKVETAQAKKERKKEKKKEERRLKARAAAASATENSGAGVVESTPQPQIQPATPQQAEAELPDVNVVQTPAKTKPTPTDPASIPLSPSLPVRTASPVKAQSPAKTVPPVEVGSPPVIPSPSKARSPVREAAPTNSVSPATQPITELGLPHTQPRTPSQADHELEAPSASAASSVSGASGRKKRRVRLGRNEKKLVKEIVASSTAGSREGSAVAPSDKERQDGHAAAEGPEKTNDESMREPSTEAEDERANVVVDDRTHREDEVEKMDVDETAATVEQKGEESVEKPETEEARQTPTEQVSIQSISEEQAVSPRALTPAVEAVGSSPEPGDVATEQSPTQTPTQTQTQTQTQTENDHLEDDQEEEDQIDWTQPGPAAAQSPAQPRQNPDVERMKAESTAPSSDGVSDEEVQMSLVSPQKKHGPRLLRSESPEEAETSQAVVDELEEYEAPPSAQKPRNPASPRKSLVNGSASIAGTPEALSKAQQVRLPSSSPEPALPTIGGNDSSSGSSSSSDSSDDEDDSSSDDDLPVANGRAGHLRGITGGRQSISDIAKSAFGKKRKNSNLFGAPSSSVSTPSRTNPFTGGQLSGYNASPLKRSQLGANSPIVANNLAGSEQTASVDDDVDLLLSQTQSQLKEKPVMDASFWEEQEREEEERKRKRKLRKSLGAAEDDETGESPASSAPVTHTTANGAPVVPEPVVENSPPPAPRPSALEENAPPITTSVEPAQDSIRASDDANDEKEKLLEESLPFPTQTQESTTERIYPDLSSIGNLPSPTQVASPDVAHYSQLSSSDPHDAEEPAEAAKEVRELPEESQFVPLVKDQPLFLETQEDVEMANGDLNTEPPAASFPKTPEESTSLALPDATPQIVEPSSRSSSAAPETSLAIPPPPPTPGRLTRGAVARSRSPQPHDTPKSQHLAAAPQPTPTLAPPLPVVTRRGRSVEPSTPTVSTPRQTRSANAASTPVASTPSAARTPSTRNRASALPGLSNLESMAAQAAKRRSTRASTAASSQLSQSHSQDGPASKRGGRASFRGVQGDDDEEDEDSSSDEDADVNVGPKKGKTGRNSRASELW